MISGGLLPGFLNHETRDFRWQLACAKAKPTACSAGIISLETTAARNNLLQGKPAK